MMPSRRAAFLAMQVFGLALVPWVASGQSRDDPPDAVGRSRVLWSADHEDGTLIQWTDDGFRYPGGGVFNTGGPDVSATASTDVAHSGRWSVKTVIRNAFRARNGNRAVRLMRWTDRAWDDGGDFFPSEACYSAWIYFPHACNPNKYPPWDPGDGGWWNVFQFKSEAPDGASEPVWSVNVGWDDQKGRMFFYLYSQCNSPSSHSQREPLPIPAGKWVHLEAAYRSATGRGGRIRLWQDGRKIFDLDGVTTSLGGKDGMDVHPIFGIGNYTDHVAGDPSGGGTATVYFDDVVVSTGRVFRAGGGIADGR